jgi:hypothetical protein
MTEDGKFDVDSWRTTDELPLREALICLVYAWESRLPWHPDRPVNHRAWLLRMAKATTDARACLELLGTEDERLSAGKQLGDGSL